MIIPDSLELKIKLLHSHTTHMKIKSGGHKIGQIAQTEVNGIKQFELINAHNDLIAIGRYSATEHGSVMEVYDEFNIKIGSIDHRVLTNGNQVQQYQMRNGQGHIVGAGFTQKLENTDAFEINIFDITKIKVGEMQKSKKGLYKTWEVKIFGSFDRRILIMVPSMIQMESKYH